VESYAYAPRVQAAPAPCGTTLLPASALAGPAARAATPRATELKPRSAFRCPVSTDIPTRQCQEVTSLASVGRANSLLFGLTWLIGNNHERAGHFCLSAIDVRVTVVCLLSSEAAYHRPQGWPAPCPFATPLLQVERAPQYSPIELRKCQGLSAPTPVSLVPTLASRAGCEVSLERWLQPLHPKPVARVAPTPAMIWKVRACLRTSIFVHRSDGRTTNVHVDLMASRYCIVVSPARLESQLRIVQQ